MPLTSGTSAGFTRYAIVSFGLFTAWAGSPRHPNAFAMTLAACGLGAYAAWMGVGSHAVLG